MPEFLPYTKPGMAVTRKASAAITGGQIVAVTGSLTVGPAGAISAAWVGVAGFDAAVNENVTVYRGGEGYVTATGAVAAGDVLVTAAGGTVSTAPAVTTPTAADVNNTRAVVGIASTAAATGAKVLVSFVR